MTTPNVNDLPGFYEWLRNKVKGEEAARKKEPELIPLELTIEAPVAPAVKGISDENGEIVCFEIDMNEVDHNTVSEDILKF